MPVWLRNFRNNLRDRQVAILHGNVRDLYIDDDEEVYNGLTTFLERAAQQLARENLHFSEMVFYDSSGQERRVRMKERVRVHSDTKSRNQNFLGREDEKVSDIIPDPSRVIGKWLRELSDPSQSRFCVIYYLDKLIPFSTSYQVVDRVLLLWLEKLIDNITENNRLILVALKDTMVPVELYTNSPKAFVQSIPMPDLDDRKTYLRRILGNAENVKTFFAHLKPQKAAFLEEEKKKLMDEWFQKLANLTDGLFLRDLKNLSKEIANQTDFSDANLRRLLNQYRFGEQKDYFGQLSIDKIDGAVDWFHQEEAVKGQREGIEKVREVLTLARAGLAGVSSGTGTKPKGVLFFAGPTGVGKTLVAKKLAKFLFDNEDAFLRFDMSEFMEEHSVSKLIGSPPGYVGSEKGGALTNGVREKPFSVVLFDEIEKAHEKIMDIFLQILDEGRLTDSRGQTVFFTETIIIFTSNIGTRANERDELDEIRLDQTLSEEEKKSRIRKHFLKTVNHYFTSQISRPELLNRFGRNIIPFNFIDDLNTQKEIFESRLKMIKCDIENIYRKAGHKIMFDDSLAEWLARRHGPQIAEFGGRGIVNCVESEVVLPIAIHLLRAERNSYRATIFLKKPEHGNRVDIRTEKERDSATE